jgi:hypothetical protein
VKAVFKSHSRSDFSLAAERRNQLVVCAINSSVTRQKRTTGPCHGKTQLYLALLLSASERIIAMPFLLEGLRTSRWYLQKFSSTWPTLSQHDPSVLSNRYAASLISLACRVARDFSTVALYAEDIIVYVALWDYPPASRVAMKAQSTDINRLSQPIQLQEPRSSAGTTLLPRTTSHSSIFDTS